MYHNISYSMSEADFEEIKAAIATINDKMPFLVVLTPDERRKLSKVGAKRAAFVAEAATVAKMFPEILPASFSLEEYRKDTTLFSRMRHISILLNSVTEKVDHTCMAIGSESLRTSLDVYAYVQTAAPRTPGLQSVWERLRDSYRRDARPRKPDENGN